MYFILNISAYADREYMTDTDKWSRIIEGTHSSLCGLFSLMTIYFFHNKLVNKYYICLGISMGSQLMNSILVFWSIFNFFMKKTHLIFQITQLGNVEKIFLHLVLLSHQF